MDALPSLSGFTLDDLASYKQSGFLPGASSTVRYFHAGRDNIRGVVLDLIARARHSLIFSMYGYDDEPINAMILDKMRDPSIHVVGTLDKSQAGGVHEKKLLELDRKELGDAFNTHFAIGQSEFGHQILHTKGFIVDGSVMVEGSVNWSDSGEGAFVGGSTQAGGVGFKAQANTMSVSTCGAAIGEFDAVLRHQHDVALEQMAKAAGA
jgi:hypothetical protein